MNSLKGKAIAVWSGRLIRVAVTLLFLKAGVDKIIDPETFARSIQGYQMVSLDVIIIMTWFLPWLEVWSAVALWLNSVLRKAGWVLILLMLMVFTGAKVAAVLRGLDISCGCTSGSTPLTWWSVGQNGLWMAVALVGLALEWIFDEIPPSKNISVR